MKKISLIHVSGPYGDACSSYSFTISNEMTLKEFVELIVNENPNEWGVVREGSGLEKIYAEYRWGEIKYLTDTPDKIIIYPKGRAHGGWSNMDYYVKEENKQLEIDLNSIDYNFVI